MSDNKSEELAFCMIPSKNNNGEISVYPHPLFLCSSSLSNGGYILKGRFNEDKTGMIPSDENDLTKLEEYINTLREQEKCMKEYIEKCATQEVSTNE